MPRYRVLVKETVYTNYYIETDGEMEPTAIENDHYDSETMESTIDEIVSIDTLDD